MRAILVGRNPRRTLLRVAVLVAVAVVVFRWVLLPVRAQGVSMQPTYEPGSFHLVNRLAFARGAPARGDVVAIRLAGPGVVYVKRIIGLPGERVRISDGQVFVNDAPLEEPYVKHRSAAWSLPEAALGAGEYFVVGDNRGMPIGQHELGKTSRARIVGRVVF
jgi:signal peptidase I